jgi:hypothetical protein
MAHIPGLGSSAYTVGSWHSAPTPTLLRSEVRAAAFDFEWSASGTAVYTVTVKGAFRKSAAARGCAQLESLDVRCSCPDGVRQLLASAMGGKLCVCKHGAAALRTVLDPAVKAEAEKQTKLREQQAAKEAAKLAAERVKQEKLLPGERARIEHGLTKREADDVVKLLLSQICTVDGLRAAATLFPPAVFPPPSIRHCKRCRVDYDLHIPAQRVCRLEHPFKEVRTTWEDSKHCYDECGKCGKTFNMRGYMNLGEDPDDRDQYCWEGTHKPEDESSSDDGEGDDK